MRRLVGKQPAPRATIQEVFEALNRPGVERLKTALRARNIPFTNEEVRDVVKGSEAKQLMAMGFWHVRLQVRAANAGR